MKGPEFDINFDKNMNATLLITCGGCSHKTKLPLKQTSPSKKVNCSCGNEFSLGVDDLRKIQQELDKLKRTLDSF